MLAQMVAKTSWLPHPETVEALGKAVFPTVRARKGFPRCSHLMEDSQPIGMFDDNATPSWALLWSHSIQGRPQGWAGPRRGAAGRPIQESHEMWSHRRIR